jgi:hypothetical protein
MSQAPNKLEKIKKITSTHSNLFKRIFKELDLIIKGKREIMYSDIINLIIREGYRGEIYNEIILWCNYNIRQGKYIVVIEQIKL